ncbi:MAG: hypothetical protein RMK93_08030 [Bacteroidota bacterium]|nr:hypothetical protein [Bacteroidota bacterium]
MLPTMQRRFAEHVYTPERYARFRTALEEAVRCPIEFRVCEAPIFVSHAFRRQLEQAAEEITLQCATARYRALSERAIPEVYRVPNEPQYPLFAVVDFAVVREQDEGWGLRLVELQGFPSLFAYQYFYARLARETYGLEPTWTYTFSNLSDEQYWDILRRAILADCAPEEVVLADYRPEQQKTRPDFTALEHIMGIEAVDICSLRKEGKRLFRWRNGSWIPVRRIFNRAIVDELEEYGACLPFRWTDEIEVEWAGHPNWYFRMSKFALPYLQHPTLPKTYRLSELAEIPDDLSSYVLKPLFSFAGRGVVLQPTKEHLEAIPKQEWPFYILQERIAYAACIYTPVGMNTVELRVMLVWLPEWQRPLPVMALARTGRAALMGVRYNDMPWAGSSGCLFGERDAEEKL